MTIFAWEEDEARSCVALMPSHVRASCDVPCGLDAASIPWRRPRVTCGDSVRHTAETTRWKSAGPGASIRVRSAS